MRKKSLLFVINDHYEFMAPCEMYRSFLVSLEGQMVVVIKSIIDQILQFSSNRSIFISFKEKKYEISIEREIVDHRCLCFTGALLNNHYSFYSNYHRVNRKRPLNTSPSLLARAPIDFLNQTCVIH